MVLTILTFPGLVSNICADEFPPKPVELFLSQHCYDCHDDSVNKGDLNLLDLKFKPDDEANFFKWVRIFDRVKEGEMPPKKKPRPAEAKKNSFLENLKTPLVAADLADKKANGRVQVRRLTRLEYEHTIHDLIGVEMPLQELLPEDSVTNGFETVAIGQQLSHHNLARYLDAADLILNNAFARAASKEEEFLRVVNPEQLSYKSGGNYRGPQYRESESLSWPIPLQFSGRMPKTAVPKDGFYRITLKNVRAVNPKNGVVWGSLRSGACSSNDPILYPIGIVEATTKKRDLVYQAWIRKGDMLELKPNDVTLAKPKKITNGGHIYYKNRNLQKEKISGIANSGIKIERIFPNSTREELRRNLFPGITKEDSVKLQSAKTRKAIIEKAIQNFANRAFRRPTTKDQIAPYLELAMAALEVPKSRPRDGLQNAYRAILCSPRFLTFVEQPGRLDDHAQAARLSYALWNSMPDKHLRKLADAGKLQHWKVFHDEVDRMLDDPKTKRFFESFTDQWLDLKEIDFTSPDQRRFRTFDTVVQASMLEETRAFVREIVLKNHPVTTVIDSDFAMLNERLARFYSMEKLPLKLGAGVQKVSLGKNQRGGLVTQGSVLKVTANGTTTSPVIRGVFMNSRILGLEIPPPPANTPAVEPDIRGAVSLRDQLEKHKNSETCASCHVYIDPPGFALESYDPVGLLRTKYGTKKNSAKVDPSGVTPEGVKFADIRGWKKIYMERPEQLSESFIKQLLTYATGAPPRFSDRDSIAKILGRAEEKEYKMRSIFHAVVGSKIFRTK